MPRKPKEKENENEKKDKLKTEEIKSSVSSKKSSKLEEVQNSEKTTSSKSPVKKASKTTSEKTRKSSKKSEESKKTDNEKDTTSTKKTSNSTKGKSSETTATKKLESKKANKKEPEVKTEEEKVKITTPSKKSSKSNKISSSKESESIKEAKKTAVASKNSDSKLSTRNKVKASEIDEEESSTNPKAKTTKSNSKKTTTSKKLENTKSSIKKTSTRKKTTSSKAKTSTTKRKIEVLEYYDLPYRYNQTIVKVLAQTPTTLFVYWDISDSDRQNLINEYGEKFFEETKPVLIIHNQTNNYSFEVQINDFANSWYLHIPDSKCVYNIELGRKPINQHNQSIKPIPQNYIYITSSNKMETPNDHILFDSLGDTVYFRNVKTNIIEGKKITSLSFIQNIGKIYNIYDIYQKIYPAENIKYFDLNNPSSGNSSSFFK